jgi:ferredoxin
MTRRRRLARRHVAVAAVADVAVAVVVAAIVAACRGAAACSNCRRTLQLQLAQPQPVAVVCTTVRSSQHSDT